MKKTLLLLTAGVLVGVGASQLLRAAESPPVYSVAEINVRDKAAYGGSARRLEFPSGDGTGKRVADGVRCRR